MEISRPRFLNRDAMGCSFLTAAWTVILMVMLSGTHTPLENMPAWLRHLMSISPMRYFIDITYGILLRGTGLDVLWDSVLAMAALGVVLFALGMWRFRRQFG